MHNFLSTSDRNYQSKQRNKMRTSTTIANLILSWFLCCITKGIDIVNAETAMSKSSNLLGLQSSLKSMDKNVLIAGSSKLAFLRPTTSLALLKTRGGADFSDDEDDSYDEESEDDFEDDEDLFGDMDLDMDNVDDFKEENTIDRFVEAYHRTPPMTKAYLTASFAATALGYITSNNEFPPYLSLDWIKVLKGGQIWRPLTAFLNLGSLSFIGYPLTVNFMHQYMSHLERLSHSKPYDFWIMITFCMSSMLVIYPLMGLSPRFLGHNLSTFLVYVWSRMFEGLEVGVFDFIQIKAEMLPWFMVAQVRHI